MVVSATKTRCDLESFGTGDGLRWNSWHPVEGESVGKRPVVVVRGKARPTGCCETRLLELLLAKGVGEGLLEKRIRRFAVS